MDHHSHSVVWMTIELPFGILESSRIWGRRGRGRSREEEVEGATPARKTRRGSRPWGRRRGPRRHGRWGGGAGTRKMRRGHSREEDEEGMPAVRKTKRGSWLRGRRGGRHTTRRNEERPWWSFGGGGRRRRLGVELLCQRSGQRRLSRGRRAEANSAQYGGEGLYIEGKGQQVEQISVGFGVNFQFRIPNHPNNRIWS